MFSATWASFSCSLVDIRRVSFCGSAKSIAPLSLRTSRWKPAEPSATRSQSGPATSAAFCPLGYVPPTFGKGEGDKDAKSEFVDVKLEGRFLPSTSKPPGGTSFRHPQQPPAYATRYGQCCGYDAKPASSRSQVGTSGGWGGGRDAFKGLASPDFFFAPHRGERVVAGRLCGAHSL